MKTGHYNSSQSWALLISLFYYYHHCIIIITCSINQMYLQALTLVLSDGSNQIMWQHMACGGWRYKNALWVRLMKPQLEEECMQYSSASSIQAWNSTKQNICLSIFMSTEKGPQISKLIYKIPFPKIIMNTFPTLKARNHPQKACRTFLSVTWKHIISIPWKQCTSFICLC